MIRFVSNKQHSLPFETASVQDVLYYMQITDCYGVDTETTGEWNGKNQILSLQIGDNNVQYVIDWFSLDRAEKDSILTEMSSPATTKILQNAKFDMKFFFQEGYYLRNIYDVMVAECLIHAGKDMPEGSYTLATMAKKYANMELDKTIRGVIHREGLTERVIKYAAQDVECLPSIMYHQVDALQQMGMASDDTQDELTVLGIENRACLCLGLMEYNGVKLHTEKWSTITAALAEELIKLEHRLDEVIVQYPLFDGIGKRQTNMFAPMNTGINWASPQQKLQLLQRINPLIQDTSEQSLNRFKKEHPIIPLMQEYIKTLKLYSGFALPLPKAINPITGRIHTSFWQNLKSGRISAGSKSKKDETGKKKKDFTKPNLLQIPSRTEIGKQIRSCFIPEEGWKIVGGDISGAELRILAEASQDEVWLSAFREGKDLHGELCARTFNIPIEDVKKKSPYGGESYRGVQKTLNFGISYGMGPKKLASKLEISQQQAAEIIENFLSSVPTLRNFLDRISNYAVNAKKAITLPPYRRVRWLPWTDFSERGEAERSGRNHVPQGTNADWMKCILGKIYYYLIENSLQYNIKPILPIHDEVASECKEELAGQWKEKLQQIMIESGEIIIKSIPVVVDCKIADCWEK